jgi:hypothetical protein
MTVPVPTSVRPSKPDEHDLRMAWVSVALVPVAFVLAMLVGEGLISLIGYEPSTETVPVWAALVAGGPALLILVAPGVAAVFYGRRGYRAGRQAARWPAWIGGGLAVLAFTVNLLAFILGR